MSQTEAKKKEKNKEKHNINIKHPTDAVLAFQRKLLRVGIWESQYFHLELTTYRYMYGIYYFAMSLNPQRTLDWLDI